jgi:hypothetical protein
MLVLHVERIYKIHRQDGLRCHDMHTKFIKIASGILQLSRGYTYRPDYFISLLSRLQNEERGPKTDSRLRSLRHLPAL